jgi:hypothetical protein
MPPPPPMTRMKKKTTRNPPAKTTTKSTPLTSTTRKKLPILMTRMQMKTPMTLQTSLVLLLRPKRQRRETFLAARIRLRWVTLRMLRRRMGVCNGV